MAPSGFHWQEGLSLLAGRLFAYAICGEFSSAPLAVSQLGTHGHPPLTRPDPPPGNGLLLFFRVDDFDEALPRARAAGIPARRGTAPEPEPGNDGSSPFGIRMARWSMPSRPEVPEILCALCTQPCDPSPLLAMKF
jgi:hypothetical protein